MIDSTIKVTTNGTRRELFTVHELPADVRESWFDYVSDEDGDARFFQYRGSWFDLGEFDRIAKPGERVGAFFTGVTAMEGSPLLAWDGAQTQSAWDAIVVRLCDDDGVVVGYATW